MFSFIGHLCQGYHWARSILMCWTTKPHNTVKYAVSGRVCLIGCVSPEVVAPAVTDSHVQNLKASCDADADRMEQTAPRSALENTGRNEIEQVPQNHLILDNNVACLAVVP